MGAGYGTIVFTTADKLPKSDRLIRHNKHEIYQEGRKGNEGRLLYVCRKCKKRHVTPEAFKTVCRSK